MREFGSGRSNSNKPNQTRSNQTKPIPKTNQTIVLHTYRALPPEANMATPPRRPKEATFWSCCARDTSRIKGPRAAAACVVIVYIGVDFWLVLMCLGRI